MGSRGCRWDVVSRSIRLSVAARVYSASWTQLARLVKRRYLTMSQNRAFTTLIVILVATGTPIPVRGQECLDRLYGLHLSGVEWRVGKYALPDLGIEWIKDAPIYDSTYITELDVLGGHVYGLHKTSPGWKIGKYHAADLSPVWIGDAPVYASHYVTEFSVSDGYFYGLHKVLASTSL